MILQDLSLADRPLYTLDQSARLAAVAGLMQEKHVGSVVIIDEKHKVVGIVTDRDIALTLALGAGSPNSYVTEVMSRDVATLNESATLQEAASTFRKSRVQRLPVVNDDGKLVGIIAMDDVLGFLARAMMDTCHGMSDKVGQYV